MSSSERMTAFIAQLPAGTQHRLTTMLLSRRLTMSAGEKLLLVRLDMNDWAESVVIAYCTKEMVQYVDRFWTRFAGEMSDEEASRRAVGDGFDRLWVHSEGDVRGGVKLAVGKSVSAGHPNAFEAYNDAIRTHNDFPKPFYVSPQDGKVKP